MPNKAAAEKALRQTKRHRERNVSVKNRVRDLVRHTQKAMEAKDEKKAQTFLVQAIKSLDKAVQAKILKKRTVARKKSSLMRAFQSAGFKSSAQATPSVAKK